MLFNSIDFLFFFPIVVFLFFIIPKRLRSIWLLVSSYYFYMSWNPKYAVLMGISTGITYICGFLTEEASTANRKKIIVALSLISNLGILAVFKYTNFAIESISSVFNHFGLASIDRRLDLLLPVGISFYTFQALSYTMDVYRGNIKAEKNFINYTLFVSFFPQLVAGPIERSGNLLKQIQEIQEIKVWKYDQMKNGLLLMLWGLFQKLVIADRASIVVNQVFNNYQNYGFVELVTAAILFAFQIYCDFGGYTSIARGAAQVMGFSLMNNFKQPYLATSIKEFWRRWHISLTSWFTDYLYIPLGGNRKGTIRKYINIFIIFGVSGLWHGASWHFVAWGLIHAVYQIFGDIKGKLLRKAGEHKADSISTKIRQGLITFVLTDIAWVFFAADSIRHALLIFKQMCSRFIGAEIGMGLEKGNWIILLLSIVLLFAIDVLHERGESISLTLDSQELWSKYLVWSGLIWMIIMLGIYGTGYDTSQFIYFQF